MYSLDPDFLRTFLAISEAGGFASAADRINKTQSTVSAQVKRLEEVLGARLFEKVGRRNVLTPEGSRLLEYARAMVRLNDETVHAFRPPDVSGAIKIGMTDDYAQAFLPEALASFARSFPSVEVEIVTGSSHILLPQLETQHFDAVVVLRKTGDASMEVLRTDQLHWIGPIDGVLQFDDPMPLSLWTFGCAWRDMALAALAKKGRAGRIAYTTSNAALLAATVSNHLGITVGPNWFLTEGLQILTDLDEAYPLGKAEFGIKLRKGKRPEALDAFADHLRAHIGQFIENAA